MMKKNKVKQFGHLKGSSKTAMPALNTPSKPVVIKMTSNDKATSKHKTRQY